LQLDTLSLLGFTLLKHTRTRTCTHMHTHTHTHTPQECGRQVRHERLVPWGIRVHCLPGGWDYPVRLQEQNGRGCVSLGVKGLEHPRLLPPWK